MQRESWEELVVNQNAIANQIIGVFDSMKKLNKQARTEEKLTTLYSKVRSFWTQFRKNHRRLIVDPITPADYEVEFKRTEKVIGDINNFVIKLFPEFPVIKTSTDEGFDENADLEEDDGDAGTAEDNKEIDQQDEHEDSADEAQPNEGNDEKTVFKQKPNIGRTPPTTRNLHEASSSRTTSQRHVEPNVSHHEWTETELNLFEDRQQIPSAHLPPLNDNFQREYETLPPINDRQLNRRSNQTLGSQREIQPNLIHQQVSDRNQQLGLHNQFPAVPPEHPHASFTRQNQPNVQFQTANWPRHQIQGNANGQQMMNQPFSQSNETENVNVPEPAFHSTNYAPRQQSMPQPTGTFPTQQGTNQPQPMYYWPTPNGMMPMPMYPMMTRLPESTDGIRSRGFKIADLKLKPFSGEFSDYKNFRRSFMKLHEEYDDGEKLEYLREKLLGSPYEEIRYLDNVPENYSVAWQILDEAYNNERFQLENCLRKLFNMPNLNGKSLQSIKTFKQEVNGVLSNLKAQDVTWEDIVSFYAVNKMEARCQDEFYSFLPPLKKATANDLMQFIKRKEQAFANTTLDLSSPFHPPQTGQGWNHNRRNRQGQRSSYTNAVVEASSEVKPPSEVKPVPSGEKAKPRSCFICDGDHRVKECPKFLSAANRVMLLKECKICIYCLGHKFNHRDPCKTRDRLKCEICGNQHLSILHAPGQTVTNLSHAPCKENVKLDPRGDQSNVKLNATKMAVSRIILPTAAVTVASRDRGTITARCLLDQGSQSCYITADLVQQLGLARKHTCVNVMGVGGQTTMIKQLVTVTIHTQHPDHPTLTFKALVIPKITDNLPGIPHEVDWRGLDVPLADPMLNKPAAIKLLIGSNKLPDTILEGVKKINGYLVQNTVFGWVVSGPSTGTLASRICSNIALTETESSDWQNFEEKLLRFWEIPMHHQEPNEAADDYCERLFREKHYRTADGRYVIPIPWKKDAATLGNSYNKTVRFYLSQEARWRKVPTHKQKSDEFMREYIQLKHMTLVDDAKAKITDGSVYYVPYISILRESSLTTKLRNVFNASAATDNSVSLNDIIYPGPALQTKIPDVITKARQFKFIVSGDIKMFFRQINVLPEDAQRIRIVWRENKWEPLKEYTLNTITYGIDASPWMAIRTLHQCADDNGPDEKTKETIKTCFYMDDLLTGANSIEECRELIAKIDCTLAAAQLPLTKWTSNHPDTLTQIPKEKQISSYYDDSVQHEAVKMLGINYNPADDSFSLAFQLKPKIIFTKRGLLSLCASIYDPLGWFLPVVMRLRMLVQSLWKAKLDWDDSIDEPTKIAFEKTIANIHLLTQMKIPRWTGAAPDRDSELVGFCDASGDAYAAVIYCRTKINDSFRITLLAAKGHVVPLKRGGESGNTGTEMKREGTEKSKISNALTIPKLELMAVSLLIELYQQILGSFEPTIKFTIYSDSEIVIAWIRNQKQLDNKFVKRRITSIRQVIHPVQINHVKSADNPSDLPSRGATVDKLLESPIWFNGPIWLTDEVLPRTPFRDSIVEDPTMATPAVENDNFEKSYVQSAEFEKVATASTLSADAQMFVTMTTRTAVDNKKLNQAETFSQRFSNWYRLIRSTAFMLRLTSKKQNRNTGALSAEEVINGKIKVLELEQRKLFASEISTIKNEKKLPHKSWLTTLDAFIDTNGLLRVGGRLSRNRNLSFDNKHPVILEKGHLIDLIIRSIHKNHGHAGVSLTTSLVRQEFWVPALRKRVSKLIRECIVCIRWKGLTIQPKMSDLPAERTTAQPVFDAISLDLAGPFMVRASRIKFDRKIKVWVIVFSCQVTRMTHLEICLDLSTEEFLAAWSRFTSRRGLPKLVLSDNQTSLVATGKLLRQAWNDIKKEAVIDSATNEVRWIFSPPRAPHFNGGSEAMVKSFKYFLKRMTSIDNLRIDEFHTIVCKVEGFMNSRPLYALTAEANEPTALTPFLLAHQRELGCSPLDAVTQSFPLTRRFAMMKAIQKELWQRFRDEHLTQLQRRYKWKFNQPKPKVGDVVLIKELQTPPNLWPMGIIEKCIPNEKGEIRRAEVRTIWREIVPRATCHLIPLLSEADATEAVPNEEETQSPQAELAIVGKSPQQSPTVAVQDSPTQWTTQQKPRRSPRNIRAVTLITQVLLCLLSYPKRAEAAVIFHHLAAGTSAWPLQQVERFNHDLDLKLKTSCNITEDLNIVQIQLEIFKNHCARTERANQTELATHCGGLFANLQHESSELTKAITMDFPTTPKRKTRQVAALLGGLAKYGPKALLYSTMAYTAVETINLRRQMTDLKGQTQRMAELALELDQVEYESLDQRMDTLDQQLRRAQLFEETTAAATGLQVIISTVRAKYERLTLHQPLQETINIFKANPKYEQLKLPTVTGRLSVLHLRKPLQSVVDGVVYVTYSIPLVSKQPFLDVAIVRFPGVQGPFELTSIAVTEDHRQFFSTNTKHQLFNRIFVAPDLLEVNSCILQLLNQLEQNNSINCNSTMLPAYDQTSSLRNDLTLITTLSTVVSCPSKNETIQQPLLVFHPEEECEVLRTNETGHHTFESHQDAEQSTFHYATPEATIKEAPSTTINPRIGELKQLLKKEIKSVNVDKNEWLDWNSRAILTIIGSTACLLLLSVTLFWIRWEKTRAASPIHTTEDPPATSNQDWLTRWARNTTETISMEELTPQ